MIELLARFWCAHFHGAPFRPFRGYYRCRVCLRAYAVPWLQQPPPPEVPLGSVEVQEG